MKMKTTMRYNFIPAGMAIIKKNNDSKCWWWTGDKECLCTVGGNIH
jgi:hypothetical protein